MKASCPCSSPMASPPSNSSFTRFIGAHTNSRPRKPFRWRERSYGAFSSGTCTGRARPRCCGCASASTRGDGRGAPGTGAGAVVRVTAGLMESMTDMGLKSLTADVRYARVDFKGEQGSHWLPATAAIEVETAHQRWRNTHTFSNYKQFSVDVKSEVGTSK